MAEEEYELVFVENESVLAWRTEQFIGMGFTEEQAETLGKSRADVTEARKLVRMGCPHDFALVLMLPLDVEAWTSPEALVA